MVNTRTKLLSALASAGVLAAGWGAATDQGAAVTGATTTDEGAAVTRAPATPRPAVRSGSTTSSSAAPGSDSAGATGTFTGARETHPYGSVTVTVTLKDGRITALSEQVATDGDRHSQRINAQAVPMLKQSLIGTDGSDASTISGATYTTGAYLTSLQSALDKAGR